MPTSRIPLRPSITLPLGAISLLALATAGLVACGGDDSGGTFTCRAFIDPAIVDYAIDGNALTLTDPASNQATLLTRAGGAGGDVFDTWLFDEEVAVGPVHAAARMIIENERVSVSVVCSTAQRAVSATATSRATVTATSIQTHEADEDVRHLDL